MLEVVRIVASHPEANSVDVVVMRTAAVVSGVQVLCGMAGADHGSSGLMQPVEQAATKPSAAPIDPAQVQYGILGYAGQPVLIGFLHPQVSQTLFTEKNRFMWRHPADVYATVRDNADLELSFPSGTFIRIGAAPAHEDLTGKDYDKKFKIARNLDSAPWLSVAIANAGAAPHTTLTIDPSGNVTFENAGNLSAYVHGNATLHVGGNTTAQLDGNLSATVNGTAFAHVLGATTLHADASLSLVVGGTITSSAPAWNHTGPFSVDGNISSTGTVTGAVDVIANGTSGHTHIHKQTKPGSITEFSGVPAP